jgi:diguanylate cyclase (GGDEF)-like protein
MLLYYLPLDLRGFSASEVMLQLLTFFVVSLLITVLLLARRRAERALVEQALHDPLTGLPNRRLFADRLRQLLYSSQRAGRSFSLVLLDLDGFKSVNDSLGHLQGDVVLMELAHRLRAHVRTSDTVARLGGDEFALLLPESDEESGRTLISKLEPHLRQPFVLAGQERPLHVSMGLAVYPEHGASEEVLLERADRAMYARKHGEASHPISVAPPLPTTHAGRASEAQA